jgi:hypothetical protein
MQLAASLLAGSSLVASNSQADVALEFIPSSAALGYAARAYETIWNEQGQRIVAALEAATCLPFQEPSVAAEVADATSHSGGPEHPMRLRASYSLPIKQATLVHELGHRHLWQLQERLGDVDGHMTLYLVLDRVWADVWGDAFASDRVRDESGWQADYDYAAAWTWARSLDTAQRARLWDELLLINGLPNDCERL